MMNRLSEATVHNPLLGAVSGASKLPDQSQNLELAGWTTKMRSLIQLILNTMGLLPEEEIRFVKQKVISTIKTKN
jgi:hypothetical protein